MRAITNALSGFLHLFFPRVCSVCGKDLIHGEKVMCTACEYNMPLTRFWHDMENPVAQTFWGRVPIENACSYLFFAKGSKYRPLLHQLKYQGKQEVGIEMGLLFGQALSTSHLYESIDFTIPVPLHPKKLRQRGFNQAELLAQGIANGLGVGIETGSLLRTEFTQTQTQKTRTERIRNVENAFVIAQHKQLEGKHVLLVDDVLTTGATLEACASQLIGVDGCKVSIATLAYASN